MDLVHGRLQVEGDGCRINADGNGVKHEIASIRINLPDLRGTVLRCEQVQVGNDEEALTLALIRHAVSQRADVVAQV